MACSNGDRLPPLTFLSFLDVIFIKLTRKISRLHVDYSDDHSPTATTYLFGRLLTRPSWSTLDVQITARVLFHISYRELRGMPGSKS